MTAGPRVAFGVRAGVLEVVQPALLSSALSQAPATGLQTALPIYPQRCLRQEHKNRAEWQLEGSPVLPGEGVPQSTV